MHVIALVLTPVGCFLTFGVFPTCTSTMSDLRISRTHVYSPDLHDRLEKSSGTSVSKGLRDISKIA